MKGLPSKFSLILTSYPYTTVIPLHLSLPQILLGCYSLLLSLYPSHSSITVQQLLLLSFIHLRDHGTNPWPIIPRPDAYLPFLPIVQHECIPQAVLGMDIICQAKSGMGKTAVFVLATLHLLKPVQGEVHVVVLCHTRELAFQIQKEYERFSKYLPEIKSRVFYGGITCPSLLSISHQTEQSPGWERTINADYTHDYAAIYISVVQDQHQYTYSYAVLTRPSYLFFC